MYRDASKSAFVEGSCRNCASARFAWHSIINLQLLPCNGSVYMLWVVVQPQVGTATVSHWRTIQWQGYGEHGQTSKYAVWSPFACMNIMQCIW